MSSTTLDPCFQYVVGLSDSTCQCKIEDVPADYNTSDSGIYITGLEGFNLDAAKSAENCDGETLWDIMDQERAEAVKDFKNDLLQCIRSKSKVRRPPFKGQIGEAHKMSKSLPATLTYHGLRMAFANIQGGKIRIKSIGAAFAFTGTVDLKLRDNTSDDILESITLNTVANKLEWNTLGTPIEIDMGAPMAYNYLVLDWLYTPSSGQSYRDTKITCATCGGNKPYYNLSSPLFLKSSTPKGSYGWTEFCIATGIKGSDLTTRQNWSSSNETQGLVFDVEFLCDGSKTICSGALDYNEEINVGYAYTIRFRAGARIYDRVLNSGNINRYTLLSSEDLRNQRERYQGEYMSRIQEYLCHEMSSHNYLNQNSDCFTCNDEGQIFKRGILI